MLFSHTLADARPSPCGRNIFSEHGPAGYEVIVERYKSGNLREYSTTGAIITLGTRRFYYNPGIYAQIQTRCHLHAQYQTSLLPCLPPRSVPLKQPCLTYRGALPRNLPTSERGLAASSKTEMNESHNHGLPTESGAPAPP